MASGGNTLSVPARVPDLIPDPTLFDRVCPECRNLVARLNYAAYSLGRASIAEDRYWTGCLDGARDQGLSDYRRGHADGYADAVDDLARLQREAVRSARASISGPDFAALADLRGEPDRARAQRAILRERGVA
jgi:hypothetical protein